MEGSLNTKVDIKLFKNKAIIKNVLRRGGEYVYKIQYDDKPYILKGYEIYLVHLKAGDETTKDAFIDNLQSIEEVYKEYYYSKIACVVNPHFTKPLMIDHKVELAKDEGLHSNLYIEIIFEYGGESLSTLGKLDINQSYNLMRQSATALCLLHSAGLTHFDIKPDNMTYNKTKDFLKIIDMGSSYDCSTKSIIYNPTIKLTGKINSLTPEFCPPEVIKFAYNLASNQPNFIIGDIDVYCWAMCFYFLLLQKSAKDMVAEMNLYKSKTEEVYANYMKMTNIGLNKIPTEGPIEEKLKSTIVNILYKSLSYKPEDRPKMLDIVNQMKAFEKEEKIKINYLEFEQQYQKKIKDILIINDEDKDSEQIKFEDKNICQINSENKSIEEVKPGYANIEEIKSEYKNIEEIKSENKNESNIVNDILCKDCMEHNNSKIRLACNHVICKNCALEYILNEFKNERPYNYEIVCNVCKKLNKASKFYNN